MITSLIWVYRAPKGPLFGANELEESLSGPSSRQSRGEEAENGRCLNAAWTSVLTEVKSVKPAWGEDSQGAGSKADVGEDAQGAGSKADVGK